MSLIHWKGGIGIIIYWNTKWFCCFMGLCFDKVMTGKHVDLNEIENYPGHKYPDGTSAKVDQTSFKMAYQKLNLVTDLLL